jgi:hypothetical protein
VNVDLNDPGKPAPGTVKDGYNEDLDRPRPGYLDEYLESVFSPPRNRIQIVAD